MASRKKIAKKDTNPEPEVSFTTKCPEYDVTLHVEKKHLYAPKAFLSMASPVFKVMLNSDFKEGKGLEVNLPDKKYDDVLLFLQCLHPAVQSGVSEGNVYRILPLAHEYRVPGLLNKCKMALLHILQDLDKRIGRQKGAPAHAVGLFFPLTKHNDHKDQPLENALHAVYYADLYDVTEAITFGAAVISKANPKELQQNERFMSLTSNTRCEVYRKGFELFFQAAGGLY